MNILLFVALSIALVLAGAGINIYLLRSILYHKIFITRPDLRGK